MTMFNQITKQIAEDLNVATDVVAKFQNEKIVSIFGSARTPETHSFYKDTREIAKKLGEKGYTICTGGGPGLMQAGSQGGKDANARTLGLSIVLPHEQVPNDFLDENIMFKNFAQRKIVFSTISNAYVIVPGGYGSLDELFEVLTLMQCKIIPHAPIVLFGKEYWSSLVDFIKNSLLKESMIAPEDVEMFCLADSVYEVVDYIVKNVKQN